MKDVDFLPKSSGIYQILNTITEERYIGSSKNIRKRIMVHLNNLNKGTHGNIHLQHAWNKYGEKIFNISVIELCHIEVLFERESFHIDSFKFNSLYNIEMVPGKINLNRKLSREHKDKIRNSMKGKKPPKETIDRAILANTKFVSNDNIEEIIHKYEKENLSLQDLSNEYTLSVGKIKKILVKQNVYVRTCKDVNGKNQTGENNPMFGKKASNRVELNFGLVYCLYLAGSDMSEMQKMFCLKSKTPIIRVLNALCLSTVKYKQKGHINNFLNSFKDQI